MRKEAITTASDAKLEFSLEVFSVNKSFSYWILMIN